MHDLNFQHGTDELICTLIGQDESAVNPVGLCIQSSSHNNNHKHSHLFLVSAFVSMVLAVLNTYVLQKLASAWT